MKPGRKSNLFKKIKKLIDAGDPDRQIGLTLLLSKMGELHPEEWELLNERQFFWGSQRSYIRAEDIQKALYDKRRKEKESLRKNSKNVSE